MTPQSPQTPHCPQSADSAVSALHCACDACTNTVMKIMKYLFKNLNRHNESHVTPAQTDGVPPLLPRHSMPAATGRRQLPPLHCNLHTQIKQAARTSPRHPTCIAPMDNYWSQLCTAQRSRTPSQFMQANSGGGIFTVSATLGHCWHLCRARAACAAHHAPSRLLRSGSLRRSAGRGLRCG